MPPTPCATSQWDSIIPQTSTDCTGVKYHFRFWRHSYYIEHDRHGHYILRPYIPVWGDQIKQTNKQFSSSIAINKHHYQVVISALMKANYSAMLESH